MFNDVEIDHPGQKFVRYINWISKANPIAAQAEKNYLTRDMQLLEKRRMQKVTQSI